MSVGEKNYELGEKNYESCQDICGNLQKPGLALDRALAVDYSARETTIDQARIEVELDKMEVTGTNILHVGVGNSKFAARFASRANLIDGLTVSPNEKAYADALGISNYTVYVLNKYSKEFVATILTKYDFIVDNNLASYACCKYHFYLMLDNYLGSLKPHGKILTDQRGMNWCLNDLGWIMTYEDLVGLENKFPIQVLKITDVVYALARLERCPTSSAALYVYNINTPDGGTGPLQYRLFGQ